MPPYILELLSWGILGLVAYFNPSGLILLVSIYIYGELQSRLAEKRLIYTRQALEIATQRSILDLRASSGLGEGNQQRRPLPKVPAERELK